jgi:hypothetical protein
MQDTTDEKRARACPSTVLLTHAPDEQNPIPYLGTVGEKVK